MTKCIPKQYICELCETTYSTRQNLWKHNKKFHKTNDTECYQKLDPCDHHVTNNIHKMITSNEKLITEPINNCKYCNKQLANRHSRWRHESNCKNKNNIINELKKENYEFKKQMEQMQN